VKLTDAGKEFQILILYYRKITMNTTPLWLIIIVIIIIILYYANRQRNSNMQYKHTQ